MLDRKDSPSGQVRPATAHVPTIIIISEERMITEHVKGLSGVRPSRRIRPIFTSSSSTSVIKYGSRRRLGATNWLADGGRLNFFVSRSENIVELGVY